MEQQQPSAKVVTTDKDSPARMDKGRVPTLAGLDIPPVQTASLLTLPAELRGQIYKNVFHAVPNDEQFISACSDQFDLGCRCGHALSICSHQLYSEARASFYQCARFVFDNPRSCLRFLDGIGSNILHVRSLAITYEDVYAESCLLREVLSRFRSMKLHNLTIKTKNNSSKLDRVTTAPIYLPSARYWRPAMAYDVWMRPSDHPLLNLTSLRSFTVIGCPIQGGVEEAVFKMSEKLKERGAREGIKVNETWHFLETEPLNLTWTYNVTVED